MKSYRPVPCELIDWVEHFATLKEAVLIRYTDGDSVVELTTKLKTWKNDGSAEFLILNNAEQTSIRMDNIQQLADILVQNLGETCVIKPINTGNK